MKVNYWLSGLIGLLLFLLSSRGSSAGENLIRVQPAYQEAVLEQQQAIHGLNLTYTNLTNEILNLELIPVDIKQVDPNGRVFLHEAGTYHPTYGLSAYITLDADIVTIAPQAEATVEILINNSVDLSPGGHYAAIVARQKLQNTTLVGQQYVLPAVSSLILVRKTGGEQFNLSLQSIDWPDRTFVFDIPEKIEVVFNNQGNVHVIPRGLLTITDVFERTIYRGVLNESSYYIYPQSMRKIAVSISKLRWGWPIMFYELTAEGRENISNTLTLQHQQFVYISPIVWIMLPVGGLALIMIHRHRLQRKQNHA